MKFGVKKNTLLVNINKTNIRSISANSIEINGSINVKSNSTFTDQIGNATVFTTDQDSTAVIKATLLNGEALAAQYMGANPTIPLILEDVSYSENRITASKAINQQTQTQI